MQPLNREQEATMLRWACTVGHRPGKRAKMFLQADRGLSEEQIETWWNKAIATQKSQLLQVYMAVDQPMSDAPAQMNGQMYPVPILSSSREDISQEQQFKQEFKPEFKQEFKQEVPRNPKQGQFGTGNEDLLMYPPKFPSQAMHISRGSSDTSSLSSAAPSFVTTNSTLSSAVSVPSQNWDYMEVSNRSSYISYGSSQQARQFGDAASSHFSFHEVYPEKLPEPALPQETGAFVTPNNLSGVPKYPGVGSLPEIQLSGDTFSFMGTFTGSPSINGSTASLPTTVHHHDTKTNSVAPGASLPNGSVTSLGNGSVVKVEKAAAKFACTFCHLPFTSKGDWKRHEGSQCEQQTSWVCMMGNNPAISTEEGWVCTFCDALDPGPDPSEMIIHLEREHKINQCLQKAPEDRSFKRRDKLKTHLQRVHNLSDTSTQWGKWHQRATTQDKAAWGCGFCGVCLFTWEGRLEHIAEHFEKQFDISQWSHSLIIKGLLKQPTPDFNILEAWRSIVGADYDRHLEWKKEEAAELKLKLEFRKGTPVELAQEAFRLAHSPRERMSMS